jgi:pyrroline-5-carboxylate reductase
MNVSPNTTVLSVIAGKPMSVFEEGGFTKVARSMPNTPAQIGKGMTVWSCTTNIDSDERDKIMQMLCSFGLQVFVDDEDFIDMSTSISGSGPAYVFMLMEAMIDAGVHMGFSRATATTLVHQTILGSTLYAMETNEHPVILRNSVTSPAGTTASAIYELENGKFRTVIKDAIWACYRRSLEMGDKDSNVGPGRVQAQEIVIVPKGEVDIEIEDNSPGSNNNKD